MKDFKKSNLYKNTSENKLKHSPINLNELNDLDTSMAELDEKIFNPKKAPTNETINEYYSRILYKQNSNSAMDFTKYLPYMISLML